MFHALLAISASNSTTRRLDVIRSVFAEINNASKTSKPVTSNLQILSILRKKSAGAKDAAAQFAQNNRPDLKAKQDTEITVLDEYAGQVDTVTDDLVEEAVKRATELGAKNIGTIIKALTGPGGSLEGKPVEISKIAEVAKRLLSR